MELIIQLNTQDKTPLYAQIYQFFKEEIQKGHLTCGEKIPSTRILCRHLEVSRSTVELAYEQLLSEGYIESVPYKGYYVAQVDDLYQFTKVLEEKTTATHQLECDLEVYDYDFTPNGIDLQSFPYSVWRKLSKEILQEAPEELFSIGDAKGELALRQTIAGYLHRARGVNCNPDQIIVGAGNDYLQMLLTTLIGSEHRVAFENPTYRKAYRLSENLGYEVCTVDMDHHGMNVEKLNVSQADIAYVMPSHQFPLGTVMPVKRRQELLKWAGEARGRYIIEDDYDSEFRYKGKPIPALQGFDREGKVIYIGTFSKSIAPALRMSYLVLPEQLMEVYEKKGRHLSSTSSRIDQLIVQRFLEEGYFERHLNKMRATYKGRHDTLITKLRPFLDTCTISGEHAGVHLLLTFRNGKKEAELIQRAREVGIRVYGLSGYYVDEGNADQHTIILGYAQLDEKQILEAVEKLKTVWL